jgi:hypothetical protein
MWYTLILNNGKTTKTTLMHKCCSENCQNKVMQDIQAFLEKGISKAYLRKIIYKLLWDSERFEIPFKKAEMHFEPLDKGYICKGCRKQNKVTDPYLNIYVSLSGWKRFFGKACSKECFDFFVLKMA